MSKPDPYNCQHEYDQERAELAEEARAHEEGRCAGFPYCLDCIGDWEATARECPHCGQYGGEPCEVECRDDAAGYADVEQRCSLCVK